MNLTNLKAPLYRLLTNSWLEVIASLMLLLITITLVIWG